MSLIRKADWVIEGPNGAAGVPAPHPNARRSRLNKLGITRPAHDGS